MKKIVFAALLTLMGVVVLTSCVDDTKRGDRLTTMLTIESSQDLIDACDIEVIYKGKGGVDKIDTITETKWYKIIANDSFPTEIGLVSLRYLVKPGFKPTKETCELECRFKITNKEQKYVSENRPLILYDVPGDRVTSFLDLYNYQVRDKVKEYANPVIHNWNILTVEKKSPAGNDSTEDLFNFIGHTELSL